MTRSLTTLDLQQLLPHVVEIAKRAGQVVMAVYETDFVAANKEDQSPVTEADVRAEALIVPALRELLPDVPVVAEEAAASGAIVEPGPLFWLVDPLDGTKEFIQKNGQFTVNIALILEGVPVLGVVLAPALDRLYAGTAEQAVLEHGGASTAISAREVPAAGLTVVASRSHGDAQALSAFLAGRTIAQTQNRGSSLKFCLVAEGEADLYPRLGRTMEWDTAAGHAVLLAAGGAVRTLEGAPLRYGKAGFENPHFVAVGRE